MEAASRQNLQLGPAMLALLLGGREENVGGARYWDVEGDVMSQRQAGVAGFGVAQRCGAAVWLEFGRGIALRPSPSVLRCFTFFHWF